MSGRRGGGGRHDDDDDLADLAMAMGIESGSSNSPLFASPAKGKAKSGPGRATGPVGDSNAHTRGPGSHGAPQTNSRRDVGPRDGTCPVCELYFERLVSHLVRNKSCSGHPKAQRALEEIQQPHKKRRLSQKQSSVSQSIPGGIRRSSADGDGGGGRGRGSGGDNRKADKGSPARRACPVLCRKVYNDLRAHISPSQGSSGNSDCKRYLGVIQATTGTLLTCCFCKEGLPPDVETVIKHADLCSRALNASRKDARKRMLSRQEYPQQISGRGTGSSSSRNHNSSNNSRNHNSSNSEGANASEGARSSGPVIIKGTAVPVRSLVSRRATPTPSSPPAAKAKQQRTRHIVSVTDNPKLRAAAVAAQQALAARKKSSSKAAKTAAAGTGAGAGAAPTSGGAAGAGRGRMGEAGKGNRQSPEGSFGGVAAVAPGVSRVWREEDSGGERGGAGGGGSSSAAKSQAAKASAAGVPAAATETTEKAAPSLSIHSSPDLSKDDWDTSESSGCDSDANADGGGGGAAGGGPGRRTWSGRLPPPQKIWEAGFESWAEGETKEGDGEESFTISRSGILDINGVHEKYARLIARAQESARITVLRVQQTRSVNGSSSAGDGATESEDMMQAVVECRLIVEDYHEMRKALVPSTGVIAHKPADAAVSLVLSALGIQVASPTSAAAALRSSGSSSGACGNLGVDVFPVVGSVTAGGPADCCGVAPRAKIMKVEGSSMEGKSASDVGEAMATALQHSDKSRYAGTILLTVLTPLWHAGPREAGVVAAPAAAPAVAAAWRAEGGASLRGGGGMACMSRQEHHGRDFAEMNWSVWMLPEGGVPPLLADGLESMENDQMVKKRLGFDVEKRVLAQGMDCIRVLSVATNGVAAKHGLRQNDLILAVDGKHLLSSSELSFWQEVGRCLQAADDARKLVLAAKRRNSKSGSRSNNNTDVMDIDSDATNTDSDVELVDSETAREREEEASWLRFLVIRKSPAPTTSSTTVTTSATAAKANKIKPPSQPSSFSSVSMSLAGGRGGRGRGVSRGRSGALTGRGRGAEGRGGVAFGAGRGDRAETSNHEHNSQPRAVARTQAAVARAQAAAAAAAAASAAAGAATTSPPSVWPSGGVVSSGRFGGESTAADRDVRRLARDSRRRPTWWGDFDQGSSMSVLKLRPAKAPPGTAKVHIPPGAFLVEDIHLAPGKKVPAGSKLICVDDIATGDMNFGQARLVALAAGVNATLIFS